MKTTIKNLIATAFTAIVLTSSAFAADIKDTKNVTILNDVKNINKIKVSGNVELILVQSIKESVMVYDNYYAKNALVQQQNGDLFISSFEKEKLTVVAYVNNLSELTATDNATVSTMGRMDLFSLDIKLQSKATAEINVSTIKLSSDVSDNSSLTLFGSATDLNANIESIARLNMDKFTAESTNIKAKNNTVATSTFEDIYTANAVLAK